VKIGFERRAVLHGVSRLIVFVPSRRYGKQRCTAFIVSVIIFIIVIKMKYNTQAMTVHDEDIPLINNTDFCYYGALIHRCTGDSFPIKFSVLLQVTCRPPSYGPSDISDMESAGEEMLN
jgi:hypothetical protein